MSVQTRPHYKLPSTELARWLEKQGDGCWWSVDGDPLLTGLLSFPCPSTELAAEIRRIGGDLYLQDSSDAPSATAQEVKADDLDEHASCDENNRSFLLSWAKAPSDAMGWLLVEDVEAAEDIRSSSNGGI